jgi:diguanylate cyclase (GGDEF)-like protein/putative nucleotidyltransferase with HDIG domain
VPHGEIVPTASSEGPDLAVVADFARSAIATESAEDLKGALAHALRASLLVDMVHLTEVAQDGSSAHGTVAASGGDEDAGTRYVMILDERPSGVSRVVATGRPLHVPDVALSNDIRSDLATRFNSASLLYVPISWDREVRYVAILVCHEPHTFSAAEIRLAQLHADIAAGALARVEADHRRVRQAEHDRAIARAARAAASSLELNVVLGALAREANVAVGGSLAGVYLGDGEAGGVATAGYNVPADWIGYIMRPGEGVAGKVLAGGVPAIANVYQDEVIIPGHRALSGLQTAVAVPMRWNGELRGALSVGFETLRRITQEDLHTLEAIAELAMVACRNAESYERVRSAASRDPLTGLLNHGALFAALGEEMERSGSLGRPLAAVLVDLDDFKLINDRCGHLAGDRTLRQVAAAIGHGLRDGERAARYGGDEFVVIMPGLTEAHALLRAARLQVEVMQALPANSSCSVGVAEWQAGLTPDALVDHADRALMRAKRAGKCSVHTYSAALGDTLAVDGKGAVDALAAAIEARDNYTHEHSSEVVRLADGVADAMGLAPAERERLRRAALLHDVGKLAIPNEILHKAGPLNAEEWEVMAQHPVIGERILARAPELSELAPIVRHEHEHWDGSGYPDGLCGEEIPIASRIILACDAYNAMRTDRPYREGMSHEDAVGELEASAGRQFDPEVVAALVRRLGASV